MHWVELNSAVNSNGYFQDLLKVWPQQLGNCFVVGGMVMQLVFLEEVCFLVLLDNYLVEHMALDLLKLKGMDAPQS